MSEFNLATADKAELKKYAKNELDLSLSMNMSEETMRDRIVARCNELQIDVPVAEIKTAQSVQAEKSGKKIKRFVINIPKTDKHDGSENAFVGVQGVGYSIPRGINVVVPESVVEVLRNAVQDHVTQDEDGDIHHDPVLTYPFQIVEEVA